MEQTVIRIGNSAGIVIPKTIRQELGLRPGARVQVKKRGTEIVVLPSRKRLGRSVDIKFMKMVDEFMEEHKDVLAKLAKL